jgi:hypothetical protein
MNWPPGKRNPAPVIRPDTGRSVWKIRVQLNSRSSRQMQGQRQKARNRFARDAVFEEFNHRAAMAVHFDGFTDRRPWETPRPSPEVWRITRRWPTWP